MQLARAILCVICAVMLSGCCDHARLDSKSSAATIQSVLESEFSHPMTREEKNAAAWSLLDESYPRNMFTNYVAEIVDEPHLFLGLPDPSCSVLGVMGRPGAELFVKFDKAGSYIGYERKEIDHEYVFDDTYSGRTRSVPSPNEPATSHRSLQYLEETE